jgi:hypothetical protein
MEQVARTSTGYRLKRVSKIILHLSVKEVDAPTPEAVASDVTLVHLGKTRRPWSTGVDTPRCAGPYVRLRFQTRTGKLPPLVPCNPLIAVLMPATAPHTPLPTCPRSRWVRDSFSWEREDKRTVFDTLPPPLALPCVTQGGLGGKVCR